MNKNEKPVFPNKDQALEHAALMASDFWLENAAKILSRKDGCQPMKLSDCRNLILGELDRPIYIGRWRINSADVSFVHGAARQHAWRRLSSGEYPEVMAYFSALHKVKKLRQVIAVRQALLSNLEEEAAALEVRVRRENNELQGAREALAEEDLNLKKQFDNV